MRRLFGVACSLFLLAIILLPLKTHADVNDFVVTSFKTDETLSTADKQGELHIVEHIAVDFHDYNHGLLRAIPKSYKHHSLQLHVNAVTSETGAPTQFSTSSSHGNTVLKIGNPNRTITGPQEYTIDYTLRNVISFYDDHDELYWDVNGDQWQQQFNEVTATLHLNNGIKQDREALCYTGGYGSASQACTVSQTGNDTVIKTTGPLYSGQTLTYVAGFEKGSFTPSAWYESIAEYAGTILKIAVLPVLALGYALSRWLRSGRDAKGTNVIVPQYDAPDKLSPLEVGTLLDFRTDNKDITAMVISLAVRRYIKIIETTKKKRLQKDTQSYALELVNTDYSDLSKNEIQLMDTLFLQPAAVGQTYELDKPKARLNTCAKVIRENCAKQLTESDYFRAEPLKAGTKLFVAAGILVALLIFVGVALGAPLAVGVLLAAAILAIFGFVMPARTEQGVTALEHIKGLKMYMDTAEKDRIAKLQSPNAPYASNAGEPSKTVELFEKLLPFAIVLGVEQQWAKQFESLYTSPPDWYSGNWNTFNSLYLVNSLSTGIGSAVNTSFSAPQSSSSSGFGGGGFSGGGGGGGGGGGW